MKAVCEKCNGTGTDVVPGKAARACSCRRKSRVVDLQSYREARRASNESNEDAKRVQQEVDGVMAFFNGYAPDFITEAVVDAIIEACALSGIGEPTYENDHDDESDTRATLAALFSKTKLLSLRELNAEMKAESGAEKWYPRQGSNLRPFAPEANALIH